MKKAGASLKTRGQTGHSLQELPIRGHVQRGIKHQVHFLQEFLLRVHAQKVDSPLIRRTVDLGPCTTARQSRSLEELLSRVHVQGGRQLLPLLYLAWEHGNKTQPGSHSRSLPKFPASGHLLRDSSAPGYGSMYPSERHR